VCLSETPLPRLGEMLCALFDLMRCDFSRFFHRKKRKYVKAANLFLLILHYTEKILKLK